MRFGSPLGDKGWKIDIRDPRDAKKTAASIELNNQSVSTSGNYEKFFYAEGNLHSHIMDPRTGFPAQGVIQSLGGRSANQSIRKRGPSRITLRPCLDGAAQAARVSRTDVRRQTRGRREECNANGSLNSRFLDACRRRPTDVAAGMVYEAGRPVHEAVPRDSSQKLDPRYLQAPRSRRASDAAARRDSRRRAAIIFADLLLPSSPWA